MTTTKLSAKAKKARIGRAKAKSAASKRATVERATSKVRGRVQIDFVKTVRS